jgi:hypothetical protein
VRKLTIIAVDHKLQWRDTDEGHLKSLISKILDDDMAIDLIAEEANKLPTTVAQRLACRGNVPWRNVDMDATERQRAGICDELLSRSGGPLLDDDEGYKECYLPNADEIRERYWFSTINTYRIDRVVLLCGLLHLATVAEKFRSRGWIVEEINACGLRWYVERFGTLTIVQEDGSRCCECRPNSRTFVELPS